MTDRSPYPTVPFGDVVRLVKDRVDPTAAGIERYVGIEHITPGDLRVRGWGLVAEGTTFTSHFRPGQVLFPKRRAYQRKVAVADFEGVCSGDIYVFEPRDPAVLLPELLPFICQTDGFFDHAIGTSAGSLSPRTNWSHLAAYEFPLPPPAEQRRLVEVLGAMDYAIQSYLSCEQKLDSLRTALIKEQTRLLSVNRIQRLGDLVKSIDAGKSPSGESASASDNGYGVLKVSAVGDWEFQPSENKQIDESEFMSEYQVRAGDFLVTRANADPHSVARTCIVRESYPNLMLSDKTWRIQFTPDNPFSLVGILAWTKGPLFRSFILKALSGTEAKNISQKRFLDGPFPICSPAEFNDFSHKVELILQQKDAIRERTLIATAMQKAYVTGVLTR